MPQLSIGQLIICQTVLGKFYVLHNKSFLKSYLKASLLFLIIDPDFLSIRIVRKTNRASNRIWSTFCYPKSFCKQSFPNCMFQITNLDSNHIWIDFVYFLTFFDLFFFNSKGANDQSRFKLDLKHVLLFPMFHITNQIWNQNSTHLSFFYIFQNLFLNSKSSNNKLRFKSDFEAKFVIWNVQFAKSCPTHDQE